MDALFEDRETIIQTLTEAGCPETLISGPHYGLIQDQRELRWEEVELEFSLEFFTEDVCGLQRLVALRVVLGEPASMPVLLRVGKPATRPGYFHSTEERDDPEASSTQLAFAQTPSVRQVYKLHERGPIRGAPETETTRIVLKTELWAEFDNGATTKIEERRAAGKWDYGYSEPVIENVTVLDVNGDNEPDFLFDVDNLGRRLVLTRDGEILRVIQLVTDQYSGVVGC